MNNLLNVFHGGAAGGVAKSADAGSRSEAKAIGYIKADKKRSEVCVPSHSSFEEFLLREAKVPHGGGLHRPYTFAGRDPLLAIVRTLDHILGSSILHPQPSILSDSEVALAGGAQFGKTILELNLAAYLTSQQFRNFGLYLPDDDLVEGIVDSKFRPDVVDQMDWFAEMVQVGKALNKSGKAVNRKGAFLVTDGKRKAVGMIRGLGKVPTTFSMDAAALDEVDDIEPRMMKFVRGRLTASDLRFILKIGTQRVHGRGMNKAWKDGSQGVFNLKCPQCGRIHNPEEEFPQIVRLRLERGLSQSAARGRIETREISGTCMPGEALRVETTRAPKLTWTGDFRLDGSDQPVATHDPKNQYYLGCVSCGAELDRTQPIEEHRQPELIKQRKWSYRISQLSIAAIDLAQIVARFQLAVADPEEMVVFRCDVLALPQSTSQALTPAILDRARSIEVFDLAPRVRDGNLAFGGLDMGDRCWLFAREVGNGAPVSDPARSVGVQALACPGETSAVTMPLGWIPLSGGPANRVPVPGSGLSTLNQQPSTSRLLAAYKIPAADIVSQAQAHFHRLGLSALFIDERPLVNEARRLALALNGLQNLTHWPRIPNVNEAYIKLPGGLTWDGKKSCWHNLRCAVVRFTKNKLGSGIEQTIVFFEEGGQTKFVPCIACNRFESIDRVVRELLTPAEGVVDIVADRNVRETPAMLLPRLTPGHPPILDTVDAHLITGSEREKESDGSLGDYVDGCENHFLLANAYSALAATVCHSTPKRRRVMPFWVFEDTVQSRVITERLQQRILG